LTTNIWHKLKAFATYLLLFFTVSTNAQTINLDYEPKGKIIQFYIDSLTIYTDTTSLFRVYDKDGDRKDYDLRVKNLVRRKISNTKSDTVTFHGDFIPFDDSIDKKHQKEWHVEWAILRLTREKKLKMYDKRGKLVATIVTKKIGKKKDNYIKRSYINKETKDELLSETIFYRIVQPRW